jgi:hypothetical protein
MDKILKGDLVYVMRLLDQDSPEPKMVVNMMVVERNSNGVVHFVDRRNDDELTCPVHDINIGEFNPYVFNKTIDVKDVAERVANEYYLAIERLNENFVQPDIPSLDCVRIEYKL